MRYIHRITEYRGIDEYKNWEKGIAKKSFKRIDDFFMNEINVTTQKFEQIISDFRIFHLFYYAYNRTNNRKKLFGDLDKIFDWYDEQNNSCHYCEIHQDDLYRLVSIRGGNLTLNGKTKRFKGTLEIDKKNPSGDYTCENSVLCCPFCNNAKSNLISDFDWREFFKDAMKRYLSSQLNQVRV